MLYRLIYMSSAVDFPDDKTLSSILEVASQNNQANGITGLLIYHDGNFFQTLEGERQAVLGLYTKIERDSRHTGALILQSAETTQRQFDGWYMAYRKFGELDAHQQDSFLDILSLRTSLQQTGSKVGKKLDVHLETFLNSFRDIEVK